MASSPRRPDPLQVPEVLVWLERRGTKRNITGMARHGIGKRNAVLHSAALEMARRLAESPNPSARWVGKDALRELSSYRPTTRLPTPPPGRAYPRIP